VAFHIVIEPTAEIVICGDTFARVWAGRTASGVHVRVIVHAVAVAREDDNSELDAELYEIRSVLSPGQRLAGPDG